MYTADDKNKIISEIISKLLHFNSTAISYRIEYYLAPKRRNILEMQYGIHRYAFQMHYRILLKEYLPRTQENLERDCLEHHCEYSLKPFDWMKLFK